MKTTMNLPQGYAFLELIDLQKDKKLMGIVNGLALGAMAVLGVLGHLIVPLGSLYEGSAKDMFIRLGVMIGGYIAYILLHELVHGVCMEHFSGAKPRYGYTGMYAYAGSDAYFDRRSYFIIALAPIVVLGIVLLGINLLVPRAWFWVVYFIQMGNLSGAAGDLFVTARFSKYPENILIRDSGVSMEVYGPKK